MAKNKMSDLRDHLFETIERLKNPEKETPMEVSTAKQINEIAKTLVDSARIEADLMMHFESFKSEYLPTEDHRQLPR
jgi:hypothetical protein